MVKAHTLRLVSMILRRADISIAVFACILIVWSEPVAFAAPPEWQEITAAIERRRAKAPQHRYEVESVAVFSGNLEEMVSPEYIEKNVAANLGEISIEASYIYQLDFENKWFRLDQREPLFSLQGPVPDYTIYLHDSQKGVELRPERRVGTAVAIDFPDKQLSNRIATARPLFWPSGIFMSADFLRGKSTDLSQKNCEWKIEDNLIHISLKDGNAMLTWTLDRRLDFQVTGFRKRPVSTQIVGNSVAHINDIAPIEIIEVTYTQDVETHELDGWTYSYPGIEKRFRVSRHIPSESMDVKTFQIPQDYLRPGDLVSKDQRFKVVSKEGTLVSWSPGSPLPAKNKTWLWFPGTLIFSVSIYLIWRLRNSRSIA